VVKRWRSTGSRSRKGIHHDLEYETIEDICIVCTFESKEGHFRQLVVPRLEVIKRGQKKLQL